MGLQCYPWHNYYVNKENKKDLIKNETINKQERIERMDLLVFIGEIWWCFWWFVLVEIAEQNVEAEETHISCNNHFIFRWVVSINIFARISIVNSVDWWVQHGNRTIVQFLLLGTTAACRHHHHKQFPLLFKWLTQPLQTST